MEPPALLTDTERTAWRTIPVDRYGEEGVALFRAYLAAVAETRTAVYDLPLIPAPVSDGDCDGDATPG